MRNLLISCLAILLYSCGPRTNPKVECFIDLKLTNGKDTLIKTKQGSFLFAKAKKHKVCINGTTYHFVKYTIYCND